MEGLVDALNEDYRSKTHGDAIHALEVMGIPVVETLVAVFKNATDICEALVLGKIGVAGQANFCA